MELLVECPPTYPPGAKLVFVGEAPGADEVAAREGFVGAAGRCLQRACHIAGIDWATAGRTNISKRRPPNNKFREAFYETREEPGCSATGKSSKRTKKVEGPTPELAEWMDRLRRELTEANPNLVVALGNEALEALSGVSGILNYRGSVLDSRWTRGNGAPFKVLAATHPSYIIRGQHLDFWPLVYDLKKAKREMEFPEIRREPLHTIIEPGLHEALSCLDWVRERPELKWTLDVETRAGTLACFAIGAQKFSDFGREPGAFCVPIQTPTGPYWSAHDEAQIWHALAATARANPNLCNQNILYDIDYLLHYGVEPSGVYMDTMLAHSILYPELPKGLDFLCSFYLDDVVYYKGEGRNWSDGDRDPQLWEYCCKDAVYTLRVVEKIDEQLRARGLWEFYHGQRETRP